MNAMNKVNVIQSALSAGLMLVKMEGTMLVFEIPDMVKIDVNSLDNELSQYGYQTQAFAITKFVIDLKHNPIMGEEISVLKLPVRVMTVLADNLPDVKTVRELSAVPKHSLTKLPNLGRKGFMAIIEALEQYKVYLND